MTWKQLPLPDIAFGSLEDQWITEQIRSMAIFGWIFTGRHADKLEFKLTAPILGDVWTWWMEIPTF